MNRNDDHIFVIPARLEIKRTHKCLLQVQFGGGGDISDDDGGGILQLATIYYYDSLINDYLMHDTFGLIVFRIILDFCWVNRILRFFLEETRLVALVCAYLLFIILLVNDVLCIVIGTVKKKSNQDT